MSAGHPSRLPDAHEAAALWHERLAAGASQSVRAAFMRWRAGESAHGDAFAQIEAAYGAAKSLAGAPDILALRHETLARIVMSPRQERWRTALVAGIAVVMVGSASLAAWRSGSGSPSVEAEVVEPGIYRTAVGERMTLTLIDGSTATLNTASRLRVHYTAAERRLILEAGQAFFKVAKNQSRPFVVVAGDHQVIAHGTEFDVRLGTRSLEVALLEGEISVASSADGRMAVATRLRPNQILLASGATTSVRTVEDVARHTSWRDGLILFEDERLADAVAEINRYSSRPIILADGSLGDLRVSGAFHTGGTTAFVEALELGFDVKVVEAGRERIILAARR